MNANYIKPEIKGSRGQFGRQVNPVTIGNKFIDLLFKDTSDDRPVIIELKKGKLTRESIGQILEYKSLLMTLDENESEIWLKEFGKNYYCPKLILIGSEINDNIKIAANIAGVEVRTFDANYAAIGLSTFSDIEKKQKEWNQFRKSGNRALNDREDWINILLDKINDVLNDFPEVTSINQVPKPKNSKTYIDDIGNPFMNIPFRMEDEYIAGMYEYYDDQLPFNDNYVYFEFSFVNEDTDYSSKKPLIDQIIRFCSNNDLRFTNYGSESMPIVHIEREVLETPKAFETLLNQIIGFAIQLHYEKKKLAKLITDDIE